MADEPQELQLANSLLNDVQKKIDLFDTMDKQHQREKFAKQLFNGDLASAKAQTDKAAVQGHDVTYEKSRIYFCEGLINLNVAQSPTIDSLFSTIIINKMMRNAYLKNFVKKWATPAIAAFQQSIQQYPGFQAAHHNQGLAYVLIGDKQSATAAFTKAQQGDDQEVSTEAAKALIRMNQKNGPCFVATACYGDFEHPDVLTFRRWRDTVLLRSFLGRAFVNFYYFAAPPVARRLNSNSCTAKFIRRLILQPMAQKLRR